MVEGEDDSILIKVGNEEYTVEDIGAMFLNYIKRTCYGPKSITLPAVITVPAYFNSSQRWSIRHTGIVSFYYIFYFFVFIFFRCLNFKNNHLLIIN